MDIKIEIKILILLSLSQVVFSCNSDQSKKSIIDLDSVENIIMKCENGSQQIHPKFHEFIIGNINIASKAKKRKKRKTNYIHIEIKNSKNIDLKFDDGVFSYSTDSIHSYSSNLDSNYFSNVCYQSILENKTVDCLWDELIFDSGGCLVGSQYKSYSEGGSAYRNKNWKRFLNLPKADLTYFLLSQFSDTTSTSIHTCPFSDASNGEIVVYTLQKIHKINWYEFGAFKWYLDYSRNNNLQNLLQSVLTNDEERKRLKSYWIKELNNIK